MLKNKKNLSPCAKPDICKFSKRLVKLCLVKSAILNTGYPAEKKFYTDVAAKTLRNALK